MLPVEFPAEVPVHVGILTLLSASGVGFPDEVQQDFKPVLSLLEGQVLEFHGFAAESVPSSHFHRFGGQVRYLELQIEFLLALMLSPLSLSAHVFFSFGYVVAALTQPGRELSETRAQAAFPLVPRPGVSLRLWSELVDCECERRLADLSGSLASGRRSWPMDFFVVPGQSILPALSLGIFHVEMSRPSAVVVYSRKCLLSCSPCPW